MSGKNQYLRRMVNYVLEAVLIGGNNGAASDFFARRGGFSRAISSYWQENTTKYGVKIAGVTVFSNL